MQEKKELQVKKEPTKLIEFDSPSLDRKMTIDHNDKSLSEKKDDVYSKVESAKKSVKSQVNCQSSFQLWYLSRFPPVWYRQIIRCLVQGLLVLQYQRRQQSLTPAPSCQRRNGSDCSQGGSGGGGTAEPFQQLLVSRKVEFDS